MVTDFWSDPEQAHALKDSKIVLRDSLGTLAVQLLSSRNNLSQMTNSDMLRELHKIIVELQNTYDEMQGNFD